MVGAVGLHAALIAILGPWGLGHSPIVLVWNAAMIVEVLILFGPDVARAAVRWRTRLAPGVTAAFALAGVLPFGERWGWFDTWPSFALYASHAERVDVSVPEGRARGAAGVDPPAARGARARGGGST